LSTTTRTLQIIVNQSGNAAIGLGKISSAVGAIGKVAVGAAVGGLAALGAGAIGAGAAGLTLNNAMEQASAKIQAFTKDSAKTADILDMVRERAAKTPFAFNDMATAASALLPSAKQAQVGLEDLIAQAEILAASNPSEGLEGAAFALKEAVSGDFTSIIERFNLPRQYINQLKDEGVPALEIVQRAMQELGLDADLVASLAETAEGRWGTFKDTLQGLAATVTKPIFDAFSSGLGGVNSLLEANAPLLQSMAEIIAGGIKNGIDWIINVGVPGFQAIVDKLNLLANVFQTRGFEGLFTVFEDGSSYVGGFLETLGMSEERANELGATISRLGTRVINFGIEWQTRWATIQTKAQEVLDTLQPYWDRLQVALNQFAKDIVPELQRVWETIIDVWQGELKPALDELWTAFDELFTELGFGTRETDLLQIAVGAIKLALEGVLLTVRILSPVIRAWGEGVKFAVGYVTMLVDAVTSMKRGFDAVIDPIRRLADKIRELINRARDLPSWLIPGSPTPFEIGLRGIAQASRDVGNALPQAFSMGASPMTSPGSANGNSGGIVVNVTYAPAISLANRYEAEQILAPFITEAIRTALATR
jgi:hypothetical protein